MYLSIPNVFLIPVFYVEKGILDINKVDILQEHNSYSDFTNDSIERKDIVIGVSLPTQRDEIWVRFKRFIEDYAKGKGVTLKIENADFDASKEASQVENLISQGIDILVLIPVASGYGADLIEKAHKAGIKVITYESPIQNSNTDLYVDFNKTTVGELQGKYLVQKVPSGNYIILSGDPDTLYKEGAMEYIQPLATKGDIKIVADKAIKGWDPKIAYKVVKDARESAKTIIDAAIKLVKGKSVETNAEVYNGKINVPSILITPIIVDKDNINSILLDSGYLKQSEVYKL